MTTVTEITETTEVTAAASTAAAVEITDVTAATETTEATAAESPVLPAGYMENTFFSTSAAGVPYLNKMYISDYAKAIARILVTTQPPMKSRDFRSAFINDLKKQNKKSIPVEAQLTAAASLIPTTIKLVAQKKAPDFLNSVVQAAVDGVVDARSFEALYRHFDAIYSFMLLYEGGGSL